MLAFFKFLSKFLLFDVRKGKNSACCILLAWNNHHYFTWETLADTHTHGQPFPAQERMDTIEQNMF